MVVFSFNNQIFRDIYRNTFKFYDLKNLSLGIRKNVELYKKRYLALGNCNFGQFYDSRIEVWQFFFCASFARESQF